MATVAVHSAIIPSYNRVEPGSSNLPIADFSAVPTTKPVDVHKAASEWVNAFNDAIQSHSFSGLSSLFLKESYWRDHLCLGWDFRTLKGPEAIVEFLQKSDKGCGLKSIAIDDSSPFRAPHSAPFNGTGTIHGVETFLTTTTDVGSGLGLVRLALDGGKWKAFTLFTSMRELKGHEEGVFGRRPQGVEHGGKPDRKNWQERRVADASYEDTDPAVLILGTNSKPLSQ